MGRLATPIALYLASVFLPFATSTASAWAESTACVADAESAFTRMGAERGRAVSIRTQNFFPGNTYQQNVANRLGLDNHFQGLQPLADSRYWAFTGADYLRRKATVFVAKAGTRPEVAHVIRRIDVAAGDFWHAGGIARYGEILAIPVEAYKLGRKSRILFYDVRDPENLRPFLFTVERPRDPAGAVALTRLPDRKYLLLVYDNGVVDFYPSRTEHIEAGFDESRRVRKDWRHLREASGTSMGFVRQCDGSTYLVSFRNTGRIPPLLMNGEDRATLAEFRWNDGEPELRPLHSRTYRCGLGCNFAGAAGAHLSDRGGLEVWSTYSFRNRAGNRIGMRIFD